MTITLAQNQYQSNEIIIAALTTTLSDLVLETGKAQLYHWNVKGMAFGPLHELFQTIYSDHFDAQDVIAERIRAVGGHADNRPSQILRHSILKEQDGHFNAPEMVNDLLKDQRLLSANCRELAVLAENQQDLVTNDMAIERAQIHDKFAWILAAHLEN